MTYGRSRVFFLCLFGNLGENSGIAVDFFAGKPAPTGLRDLCGSGFTREEARTGEPILRPSTNIKTF